MAGYAITPINHGVTDIPRLVIPWSNGSYTIVTEIGEVYHAADAATAAVLVVALGYDVMAAVHDQDPEVVVVTAAVHLLRRDTGAVLEYAATEAGAFALTTTRTKDATVIGVSLSLMHNASSGVILGTTAGELCLVNVSPYIPWVAGTANQLLGAKGYYWAAGCFSDGSDMRFACGLSVIVPALDLLTFTDHASPLVGLDTATPGFQYMAGYGRGLTHDVTGQSDYNFSITTEIHQKLFASGAWTLAHTFPAGSEGLEPNFFYGSVTTNLLCWLPEGSNNGYPDYAYSTTDGVSWINAVINVNCDFIAAMADDGADYWAIISNSVSGNMEVWKSVASVSGPWAFIATIAPVGADFRAIIDFANTTMFVYAGGAIWSAPAPYTAWVNVGATTGTFSGAFIRAGGAGRLAATFFDNTVEESADGGATWTVHTLVLDVGGNEFIWRAYPDNRGGASQLAFALTSDGRLITGPMTLAAWSAPVDVSGDGLRMAPFGGAGNPTSGGVMTYVMGSVPFDASNEIGSPVILTTAFGELAMISHAGAGILLNEKLQGGAAQRDALVAPGIRPGGVPGDRGAIVGDGNRMLVFTDDNQSTYLAFLLPGGASESAKMVASQDGLYLIRSDLNNLYATDDAVTVELVQAGAADYEAGVADTQA